MYKLTFLRVSWNANGDIDLMVLHAAKPIGQVFLMASA